MALRIQKGVYEYVLSMLICLFSFIFIYNYSAAKLTLDPTFANPETLTWLKFNRAVVSYGIILACVFPGKCDQQSATWFLRKVEVKKRSE